MFISGRYSYEPISKIKQNKQKLFVMKNVSSVGLSQKVKMIH